MKTKNNYRHGEIGLFQIDELPKDLKLSKEKVFMKGSHGHDHSVDNGKLYFKEDGQIFGYLVAKKTKLYHEEHSPNGCLIEDGIYKLVKQVEFTPEGFKTVID